MSQLSISDLIVKRAPTNYVRDRNQKILNPTAKSEEIPKSVLEMFPQEAFKGCIRLLVFSSGEDYGFLYWLALHLDLI